MTRHKLDFNHTVVEIFEAQVQKTPDFIALQEKNIEYSFLTLNEKANQFAYWLIKNSVKQGDLVAIFQEPNANFIICMLAIIKIGAIYVPLDTLAPKIRLAEIISDAAPKFVISNDEHQANLPKMSTKICLVKQLHLESIGYPKENNRAAITPTSPVYMIYTSGSTGKPKGVVTQHRAVVNLATIDNIIKIQQGEKIAQYCNLAFDGSIFEIWVALLNGATLSIIPDGARRNHNQLKKTINEYQINYLVLPTGYFHQLIKSFPETIDTVHTIAFGGEQVNCNLLKNFINYRKKSDLPTKLVNVYGPTEATVFSCCNIINLENLLTDERLSSIGLKTRNTKIYVVNESGQLAEEGELCVSGVHLALSYHNNPEQTKDKFTENPFDYKDKLYSRIYRTGDKVRLLPTGELLYLGRLDDQVKIGGFRIHLNEIEKQLMQHETINLAAVTVEIGGGSHKILTAYLVFPSKTTFVHADEIRNFLSKTLPNYMLPAKYVMVEKLPLTVVGKVDKTKLDAIPHTDLSFHVDTSSLSPIEETIKNIWRNLLNRATIEPNKNLFELGANSLLLTEACSRINADLKCDLQMSDMLTHPSIHKLSRFLEGAIETTTLRKTKKSHSSDIAIIGMSCRFPQANNLQEFWHNLCQGKDCLTRFDEHSLPSSLLSKRDFVPVKGILSNSDQFDAAFFGFSPIDAKITDPQHRVFLECVWEALEHAGIAPNKLESKIISVFAGMTDSTYLQENLLKSNWFCAEYDHFHQRIATSMGTLSTQTSYRLNFKGRSVNVNTAFLTGLITVDQACQDLLLGQSDIALAGSSSIVFPEVNGYFYQPGSIVSEDGYCRPFSDEANGTIFSSGVGVVVLKRLEDALRENDTIYAVIKGRGVNNDGIDKLGFTAPSISGQVACIKEALTEAKIKAEEISFLEAHGTATSLGDLIEINALTSVYREQTDKTQFCALGSVKANIGHTDVTAGIAGIIKTALSLHHKVIPPLIHFKNPNPDLSLTKSPFFVNTEILDWSSPKRYAGVSAFGVGGTNIHMILTADEPKTILNNDPILKEELVFVSAKTEKALEQSICNISDHLNSLDSAESGLSNIAHTLHSGRENFQWRSFGIGKTATDISRDLMDKKPFFFDDEIHPSIVFMFSGQGMQYPQMAMKLYDALPSFAEHVKLGCELASAYLKHNLLTILRDPQTNKLNETHYAQPALFVVEYALSRIFLDCGVKPEALVGHSIGEYVAAFLSGVFSFEDGIELVCKRGLLMAQAPRGAMIAIEATREEIICYQKTVDLDIALHNSTNNYVMAGSEPDVCLLEKHLSALGKPFKKLNVGYAFHSRFMASIEKPFKKLFANIKLSPPSVPIVSNVTGDWLSAFDATDPDYWFRHLRLTVQFCNSIKLLLHDKYPLFIEIGPGKSLATFVQEISKGKASVTFTLPNHHQRTPDMYQLLSSLGELWAKGSKICIDSIYKDKKCQKIALPTYPFQRQRYWVEPDSHLVSKNDNGHIYQRGWSHEAIDNMLPSNLKNFNYVIFKDNIGIGQKLINLLEKQGVKPIIVESSANYDEVSSSHIKINMEEKAHYHRLISSIKCNLQRAIFFHCYSCDVINTTLPDSSQIDQQLDRGFYSLLYLTQAFNNEMGSIPTHFSIITTGTQQVLGTEEIYPINASIVGASRVIPLEHHQISCELIDINLNETPDAIKNILIDIVNSSLSNKKDAQYSMFAYRNGYRWEPFYSQSHTRAPIDRLTDHGVYLVTGGLGGIGLEICHSIANIIKTPTFIFCSRSPTAPESDWSAIGANPAHPDHRKIARLQKLKELGATIYCLQADIGIYDEVEDLIKFCKTKLGRINGIIHAAGIAGGGLIVLKPKLIAYNVLLPKIHGTYHLAKATKDLQLDFVILMSSIASVVGEKGQVDYCGANACLDAFAHTTLFKSKFTASINWNTWREVGMSVEVERPKELDLFVRGNDISPLQGQELFLKALSCRNSTVIISNYDLDKYYDATFIKNTVNSNEDNKASRDTCNIRDEYIAPENDVEERLANLWQKHLHIDKVGRHDDFFALGGHSLKALTIIENINSTLGANLSIQHLYQAPTIAKIGKIIHSSNKDNKIEIVIPLKKGVAEHPPFFFCHPASGMIYCFKKLISGWESPIPLYGLQDPSVASGTLLFDSIHSIAQNYMEAIKKVQPQGPYYLIGYSFGGTVVHEIAHLLKQQNESIGLLAMIEGWCVFSEHQKTKNHFINTYLANELQEHQNLADLAWSRMELLIKHQPSKIHQDMLLFKATDLSEDYLSVNDQYNGWSTFNSGKIISHAIKSNHATIIEEGSGFITRCLFDHMDILNELKKNKLNQT